MKLKRSNQLKTVANGFMIALMMLISKGGKPEDVVVFTDTAFSALTSIVNLQADGYAYVPLGN